MRRIIHFCLASLTLTALCPRFVPAQGLATAPTSAATTSSATQPEGQLLEVFVKSVTGYVEYSLVEYERRTEDDWLECVVGQQLKGGAALRTAPKSSVTFTVPPDQEATLDRVGALEILDALRTPDKVILSLGLKYGRAGMKVEPTGALHESTIRSKGHVLAVRGTEVVLYDQPPFTAEATSLVGRAYFRDLRRRTVAFGGTRRTVVRGNQINPAEVALSETVVDPSIRLARTAPEYALIENLVSRGAVFSFDEDTGINVVRGGVRPVVDTSFIQVLPGDLNFVLTWNGDANLDLGVSPSVTEGTGEFLFPAAGLSISPRGGRIPFDHRGGGTGGVEVAFYPNQAIDETVGAIFGVGVFAYNKGADGSIEVFRNGQRVQFIDDNGIFDTFNFSLAPGGQAVAFPDISSTSVGVAPAALKKPQHRRDPLLQRTHGRSAKSAPARAAAHAPHKR